MELMFTRLQEENVHLHQQNTKLHKDHHFTSLKKVKLIYFIVFFIIMIIFIRMYKGIYLTKYSRHF